MAERNRLVQLQDFDQSVWLDSISRGLVQSGQLQALVDNDGLRGMTSNPAIFEKAISGSDDYRDQLRALHAAGKSTTEIYEAVAITDIQSACDVLRPVYDASDGEHGLVSLEVSPELAFDTEGTIAEVRRLWQQVDRPNLMIKIPATDEGVPAVQQMLTEGHNVNITLMFSLTDYDNVAEAYISALEARAAAGEPIDRIASVASFFVSRIDTLADELLEARVQAGETRAQELMGSGGDRQREGCLPAFLGILQVRAIPQAGSARRARTARAVGEHQHEESGLLRRDVRGYPHRPAHGEYLAGRHHGRVPRSRHACPNGRYGCGRSAGRVGRPFSRWC